ncbi:MAG TPA: hypothetical protein VJP40_03405, partial [bacterium]|nr:hypothetical protein [bacterium]
TSWIPGLDLLKRHLPFFTDPSIFEEEVDPFGRDPAFEQTLKPFFDFMLGGAEPGSRSRQVV